MGILMENVRYNGNPSETSDSTRCESKGWLTTRAEASAEGLFRTSAVPRSANPRNQSKHTILGATVRPENLEKIYNSTWLME